MSTLEKKDTILGDDRFFEVSGSHGTGHQQRMAVDICRGKELLDTVYISGRDALNLVSQIMDNLGSFLVEDATVYSIFYAPCGVCNVRTAHKISHLAETNRYDCEACGHMFYEPKAKA